MDSDSALIGFPMLIDRAISLKQGYRKTSTNNGIKIKNSQRSILIKFEKEDERDIWFECFMNVKNKSLFTEQNIFNSYAPRRQQQYAHWFINGQSYMEAVAKAILAAREEIFIAAWWLSPEVTLIRPWNDDSMRLDNLLDRRAEEGIRVYVLLFKDVTSIVGLNSSHTKLKLMAKSPTKKNIKIIRHPNHSVIPGTESSYFYSHHEKTVIIDQRIAFIGGIDLSWGRWETDEHRLIDLGDENITELTRPKEKDDQSKEEVPKEEAAVATTEKMAEKSIVGNIASSTTISKSLFNLQKSDQEEKNSLLKSNQNQNLNDETINNNNNNNLTKPSEVTNFRTVLNKTEMQLLAEEENAEQRPHDLKTKWKQIIKKIRKDENEDSSDEDIPQEPIDEKPKTIIGVTPVLDKKCRYFMGKDYSNSYEKDFEFIEKFDEGFHFIS
ncbi:unnamed protein product [Rotaria sp. Silwood2]|nr:unnamed protein product [Rotaria sp. Silwood2]